MSTFFDNIFFCLILTDVILEACFEEKNPTLFLMNWVDAVQLGAKQPNFPNLSTADAKTLRSWLPPSAPRSWKEIYCASKHGWDASTFHSMCDDKGATLVIATLNTGVVIGGYAAGGWSPACGDGSYMGDETSTSFLFRMPSTLFPSNSRSYSTYYKSSYGPSFGKVGAVLRISKMSSKRGSTCDREGYSGLDGCGSFGDSCTLDFTELAVFSSTTPPFPKK